MGLENTKFTIGHGKRGDKNLITDVPGVTVGHVTLSDDGDMHTGVTVLRPHGGNLFEDKVMAASYVFNGFGKSVGLVQIDELGTIETPVVMTNTLSVGTASTALVKYMMSENPEIGRKVGTVNPVVCECNDGSLNDIRALFVKEEHVFEALRSCSADFAEGAVGAGTGMSCLGFKGGIGSASRVVTLEGKDYVIGALVLSNFGSAGRLMIDGRQVGREIQEMIENTPDKGSIIMVIATDIPLSERQLKRVAKRAGVGLSRTGSYMGHGSGDIAIAFSTANRVPLHSETDFLSMQVLADGKIDPVFDMTAEAVEEAIVSSMYHAETTVGREGKVRHSLREYLEK